MTGEDIPQPEMLSREQLRLRLETIPEPRPRPRLPVEGEYMS